MLMGDPLRHYRDIWLADFEYHAPTGERPEPLCMVAIEYRSGQTFKLWADELRVLQRPPFPTGDDSLFVAYYASAELGCFLQLGWPLPARILDLFAEFRVITNGLPVPCGNGLLGALAYHGLGAIDAAEKKELRDLAIRGGPYTTAERVALIDYCESDVIALARLLPAMLPKIDLPRALLRGRYMSAVASMERQGVPIDVETLNALKDNWAAIKGKLVRQVDQHYGVYVPTGAYHVNGNSAKGREVIELAADVGCHPYYVAEALKHIHAQRSEFVRDVRAAELAARRRTGLSLPAIRRWEESGKDHSKWPGLDVTARELAAEYPALGLGRGYTADDSYDDTDHAALLWDRLREQTPTLPKATDPDILEEVAREVAGAPADVPDDAPLGFSAERFAKWLVATGIPWPRLASGNLALDDDTFREMAKTYPQVTLLQQLRHTLGSMRLFEDLAVGSDGRNRCLLSPFRARSGRNAPSTAKFIFGPSVYLRSLIKPGPDRALAYVDWSQQEFGIAAALSGDKNMQQAYASGDPYLEFAKQAGAVPPGATKDTHDRERELFKRCALGVNYGMAEESLARRIEQPPCVARELLRLHRETYPDYWRWSESAVNHAMLRGTLWTVFGWTIRVGSQANPRSLMNFPLQGNGADMLRLACCLATEQGIAVCCPVHDALLVESSLADIKATVAATQAAMVEASRVMLDGFALRSDAHVVRYPDRYSDKRGVEMWDTVMRILEEIETEKEPELAWEEHPPF
jgi:hypothetical protein